MVNSSYSILYLILREVVSISEISREIKDWNNLEKKWEELLEKLKIGDDFPYLAIKPRKKRKYFNAKALGGKIIIDQAQLDDLPSGELSMEREIDFTQFKCVAGYYNRYVQREKGIRPQIRDICGKNSSYIISLIASLL